MLSLGYVMGNSVLLIPQALLEKTNLMSETLRGFYLFFLFFSYLLILLNYFFVLGDGTHLYKWHKAAAILISRISVPIKWVSSYNLA